MPTRSITLDDIDVRDINDNMYWAYGRKILAAAKEVDAEPKGKNKRMALEAAKGGDKPKGGKSKAEAAEGEQRAE
mgnify:CR=1 FL=1